MAELKRTSVSESTQFRAVVLALFLVSTHQAIAASGSDKLRAVWDMPHQGIARFCYRPDEGLGIIYFKYDRATGRTSILKRDAGANERLLAEFPGAPDERSLSCSDDGEVVAALDGDRRSLLITRGANAAIYRLSRYYAFTITGVHSLLAPDGKSMALPEIPQLISGPDLLNDIKVFKFSSGDRTFLVRDQVYVDHGGKIAQYRYSENEWRQREEFGQPKSFGAREIVACGSHDIATLSDDITAQFQVLSKPVSYKQDWLEKIGVRKILRQRQVPIVITGQYSLCAAPLHRRGAPYAVAGLLRFDAKGLRSFSFPEAQIALGSDEVSFSKDGCYAVIRMFTTTPNVPQFTLPQQVRLLRVQSEQCL